MLNMFRSKAEMPAADSALPGRETEMPVPSQHFVNGNPIKGPFPDNLQQAVAAVPGSIVLVTNEVGAGIVPADRISRLFRDMAGLANQRLAAAADRVVWMVAGLPVIVKGGGR